MYKVDNAVIMAAGTSSRFAPLSYEKPKALTIVRGEILIERQIRQLQEAGVSEIHIVTGYKREQFRYLQDIFDGVKLLNNPYYLTRNNNASIYAAKDVIKNTYICSADNYFLWNPFEAEVEESYYSAVYMDGDTKEWCMREDECGYINSVEVGGSHAWCMLGHVFWDEEFSRRFLEILEEEYYRPETADKLWESLFIEHLCELKMRIRKYPKDYIYEFDSLDELRTLDSSYVKDTRSEIIKNIAAELHGSQAEILGITPCKGRDNSATGFTFCFREHTYKYNYRNKKLSIIFAHADMEDV